MTYRSGTRQGGGETAKYTYNEQEYHNNLERWLADHRQWMIEAGWTTEHIEGDLVIYRTLAATDEQWLKSASGKIPKSWGPDARSASPYRNTIARDIRDGNVSDPVVIDLALQFPDQGYVAAAVSGVHTLTSAQMSMIPDEIGPSYAEEIARYQVVRHLGYCLLNSDRVDTALFLPFYIAITPQPRANA